MHYATVNNKIGKSNTLPEGAVPISREQYHSAMSAQAGKGSVTVENGELVILDGPVYSPQGEERRQRHPDEPLIREAPPEGLHVPRWQGGEWIEAETAEQRESRETAEKDKADAARLAEIDQRLREIDAESTRPLRAKGAGRDNQADRAKLSELEDEADALRAERAGLA